MDQYKGVGVGNVIECENGYVVVPSYTEAIIYDKDGKEITRFNGKKKGKRRRREARPPGCRPNPAAIMATGLPRSAAGTPRTLHAEILEGHLSAGLVHTGNISYRLGARKAPGEIKEALADNKSLAEAFDRMAGHLDANGVDITKDNVQLGVPLKFDPRDGAVRGQRPGQRTGDAQLPPAVRRPGRRSETTLRSALSQQP